MLAAAALTAVLLSGCGLRQLQVVGRSMEPGIKEGDRVFLDTNAYSSAGPQRGDIVGFKRDDGRFHISRIVGLPGEQVILKDGAVFVAAGNQADARKLDEAYLAPGTRTNPSSGGEATYSVPGGQYFVLSDNRGASQDSRVFGPVPAGSIEGRVRAGP